MYNVSQAYIDRIMSQKTNIEWNWYVMITTTAGTGYALSMSDLKQGQSSITRDIVTGSSLEIGTTCSAEISLAVFLEERNGQYYLDEKVVDRYAFFGATIEIEFHLYGLPGGIESVPCGIYTVTDATRTSNVLTLTGYDNMLKFSEPLSDPEDKTCYEWLSQACTACGMQLGNTQEEIEDMPNGAFITGGYEVSTRVNTWRDMIGHVASMLCGYAYIGRDGKLYIGRYGMTPVRTISKSWRYKSEVADYETYYSSLTFTNDRRNEQMKVEVSGDGLEYAMSDNPLLQYPNSYAIERRLQDILNGLSIIEYTPFDIQTPCDPALDVGDVIELTEGQTVEGKYAAITSIVMPLNGKMSLKGVGQNPRTQEKSSLEKKIDEMNNTAYAGEARYDHYINDDEIAIADQTRQRVIVLTYEAAKNSHVDFHGEICYDIAVDEVLDPETGDTTKEAELTVSYYVDGSEVRTYNPTETITVDGKHLLNLMYFWIQKGNKKNGSFVAWLNVTGGAITIPEGYSRGYICSQGWDAQNSDDWDDPRELIYIEVTTMPTTVEYEIGDTLDYSGVVVTAYYSDNTMEDITYSCTYTPANGQPATSGLEDVEIEYSKDGGKYYTSFPIIIEGEWDDVYEVNGGRMMIATASAAMAKGDTVYFENQVGEWTDVTSDVGFNAYNVESFKTAISSDGRFVFQLPYSSSSYVTLYDTSTTPWTQTRIQVGNSMGYLNQDRDIGIWEQTYNGSWGWRIFDLTTNETILIGGTGATTTYPSFIAYLFDDYICAGPSKISLSDPSGAINSFGNQRNAWVSPNRYYYNTLSQIYEYTNSGNTFSCSRNEHFSHDASSGDEGTSVYANGKLFLIRNRTYIDYIDDLDANPWVQKPLELPTNFLPSYRFVNLSADRNFMIMVDEVNKVVGILNTQTLVWNVLGYVYPNSDSYNTYYSCSMGGHYAIAGRSVFRNNGAGTIAYKAYNALHGSHALGYALKDMSAGEKAKYRVLFD